MRNLLERDLNEVLSQTENVWKELDGASIFVTGGTGFYGCWLLESFAWAVRNAGLKANMTVLSRSRNPLAKKAPHLVDDPTIRFIRGDVRTFEFPREPCTHVIHAATQATASSSPSDDVQDIIGGGTFRTFQYAIESGGARFLLASSGAVYGSQPTDLARIPEDFPPTKPFTPYGEAKRDAEEDTLALAHHAGRVHPVFARGFAFVGPYQPAGFAVSDFLRDGLSDGVIRVSGDGTPVRSYLYAADLTVWLWHLLAFGRSGEAYNVGSNREIAIRELAFAVRNATAASAVVFGADPVSGGPAQRYVPDVSRVRDELGLRQTVELDDALERTVAWMRARKDLGHSL